MMASSPPPWEASAPAAALPPSAPWQPKPSIFTTELPEPSLMSRFMAFQPGQAAASPGLPMFTSTDLMQSSSAWMSRSGTTGTGTGMGTGTGTGMGMGMTGFTGDLSRLTAPIEFRSWASKKTRAALPELREVRDAPAAAVAAMVKLFRVMVWWVALYAVDRVFQEWYLQRMYGPRVVSKSDPDDDARPCPPPLWGIVLAAAAIEAAVTGLLFLLLLAVQACFKTDANAFVVDGPLLSRIATDYFVSTALLVTLGVGVGAIAQDPSNFRYGEDGLRGVRAVSLVVLLLAALVIPVSAFG
jgi:hypothetical protein